MPKEIIVFESNDIVELSMMVDPESKLKGTELDRAIEERFGIVPKDGIVLDYGFYAYEVK